MSIEKIFSVFNTAATGLTAQRQHMETTARNIANVETLETPEGGPYKRRGVNFNSVGKTKFTEIMERQFKRLGNLGEKLLAGGRLHEKFGSAEPAGVNAEEFIDSKDMGQLVYEPGHPMANEEGYVRKPNINVMQEMVHMMTASRAYEANISVIQAAKDMHKKALEI